MDEQVVFTMAGLCIIALIVLAFRFASNGKDMNVNILFTSDSIFVNDPVNFNTNAKEGKLYSWDFGDANTADEKSSSVIHSFKKARVYTIKLLVDGRYEDIQQLEVFDHKKDISETIEPVIKYPSSAYVNESIIFTDQTPNSKSWEWYFEDSKELYSTDKQVSYSFKKPGTKKFTIKVNKDKSYNFFIEVIEKENQEPVIAVNNKGVGGGQKERLNYKDKGKISIDKDPTSKGMGEEGNNNQNPEIETPKVEEPKPKMAPGISIEKFRSLLFKVADGNMFADDFAEYFCNNLNTKVTYNDEPMTFNEMCKKISDVRRKKIKNIDVQRIVVNESNNCINYISVRLTKTNLIGR